MVQRRDIHQISEKYASALKSLRAHSSISAAKKKTIERFVLHTQAEGLTLTRQLKYLSHLSSLAKMNDKDFEKWDKEDVVAVVGELQTRDYSPWTRKDYKVVLKKFFRWLRGLERGENPPETKWIRTNIRSNELSTPAPSELITKEDIEKLLSATEHPRDKAIVSVLFEGGLRIGELASMSISSLTFGKQALMIKVHGKTGSRTIPLVVSTQALMTWYNNHPLKNKVSAPLWVNIGCRGKHDPLRYDAIRRLLHRLFRKVGLGKKCNPHFFRHSAATFFAHHLTEAQMCQYFGWSQGSKMPRHYVHMSGQTLADPILRLHGIESEESLEAEKFKPNVCSRCDMINQHDAKYCSKCAAPLDLKALMQMQEEDKFRDKVYKMLLEREDYKRMVMETTEEAKSICSSN